MVRIIFQIMGKKFLNSNLPFLLCLNTAFVFTNYHPRQCKVLYNRAFIMIGVYMT